MMRTIFLVCLAATLVLNDEPCYCGLAKRIKFGREVGAGRIIGGESTEVNEYPWQVFISMVTRQGVLKICGGSLISDSWVLTAAHCLEPGLDSFDIDLGEYNIRFDLESKSFEMKADQQLFHPNFSK